MNSQKSDAVCLITLDRPEMKVLIPYFQKIIDVWDMVLQVLADLVIESTDVCALFFHYCKVENGIELFYEIHQRLSFQFVEMVDIIVRQLSFQLFLQRISGTKEYLTVCFQGIFDSCLISFCQIG